MSEYQTFIKSKHARLFNTAPAIIDEVVRKATGRSPAGRERIIKGEANEVRAIKTEGGQEIIVRINRESEAERRFQKERWAIEQAAKAGVPVPLVLLAESLQLEGTALGVSVEERIPGVPLDDFSEHMSRNELAETLQRAGVLLAKIHSIRTDGFGELDENGHGEHESISGMFSEKEVDEQKLLAAARAACFDPSIFERALHVFREYQEHYPPITPHLLHGDYAPKHILVDGSKITGIIDFENARGGDPIQEFANWKFFFDDRYPIEPVEEVRRQIDFR